MLTASDGREPRVAYGLLVEQQHVRMLSGKAADPAARTKQSIVCIASGRHAR